MISFTDTGAPPPSCRTCRFVVPINDTSGVCRRYPPAIFTVSGAGHPTASFAPVDLGTFWCGEHQGTIRSAANSG